MNRSDLVDRCKAIIKDAYEEATEMIVAYLELHPTDSREPLCREIDPENWNALVQRVKRQQASRNHTTEGKSERSRASAVRHARSVLRNAEPEEIADLLEDAAISEKVAAGQREKSRRREEATGIPSHNPPQDPTFMATVLKINGWLDELVDMVERGEAQIPSEFSTLSLSDIGVKAMRLKELVEEGREVGVLSRD